MRALKTMAFISFIFTGAASLADILDPHAPPKCTQMSISDSREVKKLMSLIATPAKIETFNDSSEKIVISRKELALGGGTILDCTEITQDGQPVSYFRGRRPGCSITQSEGRSGTGSGTGAAH